MISSVVFVSDFASSFGGNFAGCFASWLVGGFAAGFVGDFLSGFTNVSANGFISGIVLRSCSARRRPSPRRPQREGEHAPSFASRKRTSQPRRSFRRPPPSLSAFAPKGEGIPLSFAPRERTGQPRRSFRRPPPSLSAPPPKGREYPSLSCHGKGPASRAAASAARRHPSPHSLPKGRGYPLSFAPRERTGQPCRSFRRPPPSLSAFAPKGKGNTPPRSRRRELNS